MKVAPRMSIARRRPLRRSIPGRSLEPCCRDCSVRRNLSIFSQRISCFLFWWLPHTCCMETDRRALAAHIRAGIEGSRKHRRVFANRLQECFPCHAFLAARREQIRAIEEFARENGWSASIYDMGISVTFTKSPDAVFASHGGNGRRPS
jgi:hypothetical protein